MPDDFLRDTLLALREANRIATSHCQQLAPEWRVGAFANHRREHFNQLWGPVAKRHGGSARPVLNGNFATNHLEVTLGGIVFTPVAVQSPNEFPRDADYRRSLATSNQTSMLAKMGLQEDAPATDARLYAVFGYSTDVDEDNGLPIFAHVGFPAARQRKYVQTRSLLTLIRELGQPDGAVQPTLHGDPLPSPTAQPASPAYEEERTDDDVPLHLIGREANSREGE